MSADVTRVTLKRYAPDGLPDRSSGLAGEVETRRVVAEIVASVELRGRAAVLDCRQRFDEVDRDRPLLVDRSSWQAAVSELERQQPELLAVLRSRHENIATFARAQRAALLDVDIAVPGGRAGHVFAPVARAGCYAPGGRYPLPSSVLMTVATARAAGVIDVTLATPNVSAVMLAAAEIAGATRVLHCGGAQAIAAMACGVAGEAERLPAADVIVGPGNRYVTEAKRLLSGRVGIDMLAGPSEVLIVAVPEAGYAVYAGVIAADMLAQAEHDADAAAILVTTDAGLVDRVEIQLGLQLADLPTAVTARQAIANSFAVVCASRAECLDVAGRLAPEHLELFTADAAGDLGNVASYGGAFVGSASAEVFGDYGVGPNHTLPTSGVARFSAGLSVMHFLRARTWLRMERGNASTPARDAYQAMCRDTAIFARAEGLEAHARAAEIRASGRR